MYVKFPPGDLNPVPWPPLHKYLYLWSDHRTKGAWWLKSVKLLTTCTYIILNKHINFILPLLQKSI